MGSRGIGPLCLCESVFGVGLAEGGSTVVGSVGLRQRDGFDGERPEGASGREIGR